MFGYMESASINQLREGLNAYLDLVRQGETILIMDSDLPVARIVPASSDRFSRLESAGIIKRGTAKIPDEFFNCRRPGPGNGAGAVDALIQEREEMR